jgi:hypothetical protein
MVLIRNIYRVQPRTRMVPMVSTVPIRRPALRLTSVCTMSTTHAKKPWHFHDSPEKTNHHLAKIHDFLARTLRCVYCDAAGTKRASADTRPVTGLTMDAVRQHMIRKRPEPPTKATRVDNAGHLLFQGDLVSSSPLYAAVLPAAWYRTC